MLRGYVILLLREQRRRRQQQQQQQQQQLLQDDDERRLRMLRTRVEAAGGMLSINGIPALDARTLTHVVAAGWEATLALAPSLAVRHSGKFADYAPPGSPPKFVTERWLDDSLTAGKLLAEAEFEFDDAVTVDSGVARGQKRRKVHLGGRTELPPAPDEYTSTATIWHTQEMPGAAGSLAVPGPAPDETSRSRRIYLVGDENLAGDHGRFALADSVGRLLQERAQEAGLRVVTSADGFAEHCRVGLKTQHAVRLVEKNSLDLRAGDIMVIATQLHDDAIAAIKGESRVPAHFDARPVQMDYYPHQLVQKLRSKGVFVAYGQLTAHPELADGLARSQQQHACLQGFLTRLQQDYHRDNAVCVFDLFANMSSDDWMEIGDARHPASRKYIPAESGHRHMAANIWKALAPFMMQDPVSRTDSEAFRPEHSQQSCASAEETDVDDYEVKEEHDRKAEDPAVAVITQVSFKQGDFTRDHEWMLELEECIEQGLRPPNHDRVVKLMQMAKICDVAMDECNPIRDKYRAKALKLAALKLRGHGERLKTEQEVRELMAPVRGVGPKTTLKVIELVKTGTLRRLDDRLADPKTKAVRSLSCLGIAYLNGLYWCFLYGVTMLMCRWLGYACAPAGPSVHSGLWRWSDRSPEFLGWSQYTKQPTNSDAGRAQRSKQPSPA
eukprot:COSAG02_NODE_427_length_22498_cov_11.745212_4_plen_669_part_00